MDNEGSRRHLGHFIVESFSTDPDHIIQIDASTGTSETKSSLIKRSISLARAFIKFGLKPGDVVTLSGVNHLDIRLPYYAALMIGCPLAGIDPTSKYLEIKHMLSIAKPVISFCQRDHFEDTSKAVNDLNLNTEVIVFDDGESSLKEFLVKYGGDEDGEFIIPDFDPDTTLAWLLSTSGTSGKPKLAAFHQKSIYNSMIYCVKMFYKQNSKAVMLNLSPVQWLSAYFSSLLSPATGGTLVQTSASATTEHVIDIINQYKPTTTTLSPMIVTQLLRNPKHCDFTSFKHFTMTGSRVHEDLLLELRSRVSKDAKVTEWYGQSESLVPIMEAAPDGPLGSCGRLYPMAKAQLVDKDTHEVITEPRRPGELWIKPTNFAIYQLICEMSGTATVALVLQEKWNLP